MNKVKASFFRFVRVTKSGCHLWVGGKDKDGYGIARGETGKSVRAHRLAFYFSTGREAGKSWVCHRCDNPSCVNPDHLVLGNALGNNRDSQAKGRKASAKITYADAVRIRSMFARGRYSLSQIGMIYGMTSQAIGAIVLYRKWKPSAHRTL